MSGTFLSPNTCGFARIAAIEIAREIPRSIQRGKEESSTKYQARVKTETFKGFKNTFEDCPENFSIDFLQFDKKLPGLRNAVNKWNFRKADEKQKYLETFSQNNWVKLSLTRKKEHSFTECKGCALRYSHIQAFFPVKSAYLKGKAKQNNTILQALGEVNRLRSQEPSPPKPSKKNIKDAAKAIYDKVAPLFEKTYKADFAKSLSQSPELNLQNKNPNERRAERRAHYRKSKEDVEKQMEETAFLR